ERQGSPEEQDDAPTACVRRRLQALIPRALIIPRSRFSARMSCPRHSPSDDTMGGSKAPSPEPALLRARARGEVSADQAFERWHALYAPAVRAFVTLRVRGPEAEDIVQDVWTIFYERWRRWEHRPEMEAAEARPVLSFLYRTCHFAVMGHRRPSALAEPEPEVADGSSGEERVLRDVDAGRCLELARRVLPAAELEVLLAKLAGVPAREIARTLGLSESAVDHRFRGGLIRLRARLRPRPRWRRPAHA